MIVTRKSPADRRNKAVVEQPGWAALSNRKWLSQLDPVGGVLFLGGSTLADFRIRVAQSHLRHDLLPSFWSLVGIVTSDDCFLAAPLDLREEISSVPANNAIRLCSMAYYDDPVRHPNIGLVRFTDRPEEVIGNADRVRTQRSAVDLPSMVVEWLGFVWGAGTRGNPLLQEIGLPSAALVETAFGMASIELTPGVASASSCPEAIWQSAIWWHDYYGSIGGPALSEDRTRKRKSTDEERKRPPRPVIPNGAYTIRQNAAAVTVERPRQAEPTPTADRRPRRPPRPTGRRRR